MKMKPSIRMRLRPIGSTCVETQGLKPASWAKALPLRGAVRFKALGLLALLAVAVLAVVPAAAAEIPKLQGFVFAPPKQPDQPSADVVSTSADGAVTVAGAGSERSGYGSFDGGAFAGFETAAPNFTFVARMAKVPEGGSSPRIGIAIRSGMAPGAKAVILRHDGRPEISALNWFNRFQMTDWTAHGSARAFVEGWEKKFAKPEGLWLKFVRRYPFVEMHVSKDGDRWQQIEYRAVVMAGKVWVGMQVCSGEKAPLPITYDRLSFTVDGASTNTISDTPATYKEYAPKRKYRIWVAKVNVGTAAEPKYATNYAILPDGMDAKRLRAFLWTPGSKEILLADGSSMPFRSGEKDTPREPMRWPHDMAAEEGVFETDSLSPDHALLAHYGIVRMAGMTWDYPDATRALVRVSGIRELGNLPFVSYGASMGGGGAQQMVQKYPDFAVATAPTLIGTAGIESVDRVGHIPHLYIYGSRDGNHLDTNVNAMSLIRQKHGLWGSAPMWHVAHSPQKTWALLYPYFFDCLDLRIPAGHDFATKPAKLKTLKEEDGWLGLADTWNGNFPQAVPFKEYRGESPRVTWLPTARSARIWQAFCSQKPATVIHFPMFEGHYCIGQQQPCGWHNSNLAADEPFEIVASGPLADDLKVEFYAGLELLKIVKQHGGNPYRVTAAGLPPGLHCIYAITTVAGRPEISRPVSVMFHAR